MQITGANQAAVTTVEPKKTESLTEQNTNTNEDKVLESDTVTLSDEAVALSGSGGGYWPDKKEK